MAPSIERVYASVRESNIGKKTNMLSGVWHGTEEEVRQVLEDGKLPPFSRRIVYYPIVASVGILAGTVAATQINTTEWSVFGRIVTTTCVAAPAVLGLGVAWAKSIERNLKDRKKLVNLIKNTDTEIDSVDRKEQRSIEAQRAYETTNTFLIREEHGVLDPHGIELAKNLSTIAASGNDELIDYLVKVKLVVRMRYGLRRSREFMASGVEYQTWQLQNALNTWELENRRYKD